MLITPITPCHAAMPRLRVCRRCCCFATRAYVYGGCLLLRAAAIRVDIFTRDASCCFAIVCFAVVMLLPAR